PGWRDAAGRLSTRIRDTFLLFSVPILLKTMFAPWRRIITYPGASMGDRLRAVGDNMVSRAVGFVMRFFALIIAITIIIAYVALGGALLVLWPIAPFLGPVL